MAGETRRSEAGRAGSEVMITRIETIDAHTAGEPLRLIVSGLPAVPGASMAEKRTWAGKHLEHYRRALMREPRGHRDMYGALLTEPCRPGADAGVLFMHRDGWSTMCGHGVIATTTIALERGLLTKSSLTDPIHFDTPAGLVTTQAVIRAGTKAGQTPRVDRVSFRNVPSFVLAPGLALRVHGRLVTVDVAFGGSFFAIADAEAVGVPLTGERLPDLRAAAVEIAREVSAGLTLVHPLEPHVKGLYGVIFTGPSHTGRADLRNVTVAQGVVDRSPCGTGTAAVMAVLDAMGFLPDDRAFIHEGPVGQLFSGRVHARTEVGGFPALIADIEGSAWITGEHVFLIDSRDPLKDGFEL